MPARSGAGRRNAVPRPGLLAVACLLASVAAPAAAAPRALDAAVVWARGESVYVAWRDSAAALRDLRLTFVDGTRVVAAGTVGDVLDSDLARVRVTAGSLARVKRLPRLRVHAEPARVEAPARLRVGLPSSRRSCLVCDCRGEGTSPPAGTPYVTRPSDPGTALWVRDSTAAGGLPWPDTILVRFIDEAIDEEIALERGEIDVAVFWPGELSARLRDDPRWLAARGRRDCGVVAAQWDGGAPADSAAAPDVTPLAALNQRLFQGDLEPWPPPGGPTEPARFLVDLSLPGQREIERFLHWNPWVRGREDARTAWLVLVDARGPRETVAARLAELGAAPVFRVGCPVVFRPALHAWVEAIGADRLADLRTCDGNGSR